MRGVVHGSLEALHRMKRDGGALINVGSSHIPRLFDRYMKATMFNSGTRTARRSRRNLMQINFFLFKTC